MYIDPITPILSDNVTGLCILSVCLFITNSIINYKIMDRLKTVASRLKVFEDIKVNMADVQSSASKIQESIDDFGEVKYSLEKIKEHIIDIKGPVGNSAEASRKNQLIIDSVVVPFIDETRDNNKSIYQQLNSISMAQINISNNLNTIFQSMLASLNK